MDKKSLNQQEWSDYKRYDIPKNKEVEQRFGRRAFVKLSATGLGAIGALSSMPVMAGPFTKEDFENFVPLDKKLDKEWVKNLFERGVPEVFTSQKDELKYIGMPIGGIGCGQLYMGGDGQLWYWGIFDARTHSEYESTLYRPIVLGEHYRKPIDQDYDVSLDSWQVNQGFALQVIQNGKTTTKILNKEGYEDIRFRGEYPLSKVAFRGSSDKIDVDLEAFSPFCPLNVDDSSLPATILQYTVTNNGSTVAEVQLGGWLENAVCPLIPDPGQGYRETTIEKTTNGLTISHKATPRNASEIAKQDLEKWSGFGTMTMTLLDGKGQKNIGGIVKDGDSIFELGNAPQKAKEIILSDKPIGALSNQSINLAPGASHSFTFVLSWHFPYYRQGAGEMGAIEGWGEHKREYARRFENARAVNDYVIKNWDRLVSQTKDWNKTWYDSTLPYWFLDRAFIPLNCLASQTMHWLDNGRWWGWEGINCCPGTCQHVWGYAQGMARIFPEIEMYFRDEVDFGLSWQENGETWYRGESGKHVAHDGHAATIMRAYREHQMSADDSFLKKRWDRIKKSIEFLIDEDGNENGILEGRQFNTLDAAWYGPMAWISSMYLGALQAGWAMASEVGDTRFANKCKKIIAAGSKNIVDELFNGEYFIHKPDTEHNATNTNDGSSIDQIRGQNFIRQLGLPRVIPEKETKSALQSIYKYNFVPDAAVYHDKMQKDIPGGRWYAMAGEGGLVICSFPKGGADKAGGGRKGNLFAGYLNECMNGFEYEAISGMVWEDFLEEGIACFRAVHDRYHASKRNPYSEVECSDHYSRSLASYGIFTALCGYEYHGPKGQLAFAPKITPEAFKAPFTTAEGWGTYQQERTGKRLITNLELNYGILKLNKFSVELPEGATPKSPKIMVNGKKVAASGSFKEGKYTWKVNKLTLNKGDKLESQVRF